VLRHTPAPYSRCAAKSLRQTQRELPCAAQHFSWSTTSGAFMRETGLYDAFESTMELLRCEPCAFGSTASRLALPLPGHACMSVQLGLLQGQVDRAPMCLMSCTDGCLW
jgi:hypothetical protein